MRPLMKSERRRAIGLLFRLNNTGKMIHKRTPYYSYYHKGDIASQIGHLNREEVFLLNYQHGHTLRMVSKLLNEYPSLKLTVKTNLRVLIVYKAGDSVALEMVKTIIGNELWKYSY